MRKISISLIFLILFIQVFSFAFDDPKEAELLFMAKKAYEDGFYEVSLGMLERFQNEFKDSDKFGQARLLSGQCYFNQGRYSEALNIFEELLTNPQAVRLKDAIYFWSAEVHFKGGNFQKAAALYQKLIVEFPNSSYCPAAYYSLGWSYFQGGDLRQAVIVFKRLLEKFPNEPQSKDAAFKLIECLYNLKEYKELKNKINPILKLYANDSLRLPYLYFYLAESDYYLNNQEDASKNYLKSSQGFKDPKIQVLARLGLGWSYFKLNKYKEAEEVFSDIKQNNLDKKSLDILILGQAGLMSATNRIYEAKKLYSQVINLTTDSFIAVQAHMGLADAFFNLAEYDQAAQNYKSALDKINGTVVPEELTAKLQYNLGLAYIRMGRIDEGSEMLKKSVAKKNDQDAEVNLLIQLGENYAVQGELLKSEDSFKSILTQYPDSPSSDYAQYQIGLLQLKRSDYNAAALSFELFLKRIKQPGFLPQATYSLGLAYFHKGDYQKSIELFSKFQNELKASQLRPRALYMMGTAYIMLEKINEALNIFKDIPKLDPQDIELMQKAEYEIADCYYKLGQENEAAAKFKYLRAKYPDSKLTPDILWWLGKYYYRQNDFKVARRYFTSLTRDYPDNSLTGDAFYALGLIDNDENRLTEASGNFKKAVENGSPELKLQSRIALGDVYFQQGSFEEAIGQYKETIKENPDLEKMVLPRIADAYYRAGDYGNAKNFYSKSVGMADDKEVAGIRFSLGEVLEALGQFEEAAQQYLQSADLNKGYPELHARALLRAAKIYEDKEDFKTALKIYNRVPQGIEGSKLAHEKIKWIKSGKK